MRHLSISSINCNKIKHKIRPTYPLTLIKKRSVAIRRDLELSEESKNKSHGAKHLLQSVLEGLCMQQDTNLQ